jgi:hypothetical protein
MTSNMSLAMNMLAMGRGMPVPHQQMRSGAMGGPQMSTFLVYL